MMISKSACRNGTGDVPLLPPAPGPSTSAKSATSDFFTANTVSDSMYLLPATKMCVVRAGARAR